MISRYRSYTSYSEENGKLVPSVEPQDISTTFKVVNDTNLPLSVVKNLNIISDKTISETPSKNDFSKVSS